MVSEPLIVDLRSKVASTSGQEIAGDIIRGLSKPAGSKTLPTLLLYNERGLRLYDDITTKAPEYYLFGAEEEILRNHADEIVQVMHSRTPGSTAVDDEVVLELGAGALRKTSHLLRAFANSVPSPAQVAPITYYALDLEERELKRTLEELSSSDLGPTLEGRISARGMCATYDIGLKFVSEGGLRGREIVEPALYALSKTPRDLSPSSSAGSIASSPSTDVTPPSTPDSAHMDTPFHILFLGSSLGNFDRAAGRAFLRSLPLRAGSGDTLLLGLDHDNDPKKIEVAYNDPAGHTRSFIMNGLNAAGQALGDAAMFNEEKWDYVSFYNSEKRRHEAYYKSKGQQTIHHSASNTTFEFLPDEMINVEVSYKYSNADAYNLFAEANLRPIQQWTDSTSQYSLWLLERPPVSFPLLRVPKAAQASDKKLGYYDHPFGIPSLKDWDNLWELWSFVTLRMIPPSMLFTKPIDLRHIILFYLGHIPTFLDIHLTRLLNETHSEPEHFKDIFERGIDPHMDDPTQCHPHSEVPTADEDWPTLETILDFQARVRARVYKLYEDIEAGKIQMTRKIGRVLFMTHEHEAEHAETLLYMLVQRAGSGIISPPGFTTPSWTSLAKQWDATLLPTSETVVLGPQTVTLGHDDIERDDAALAHDVAGHEFGWDNESPKREAHVVRIRMSWRPITNGEFFEFFQGEGKDKVKLPASWIEQEDGMMVRTLYGPVPMAIAQHWPVMTSYDSLATYASFKGGRIPTEPELRLFMDKYQVGYEGGANVGFRNWHPIPATAGSDRNGGRGHNGGVWEWTSTVFDTYEGFEASKLYPGYSADFFDNIHHIVLGGSFATIPRISERRTFRNWYQKNYPYSWIGARIAYDV